MVCYSYNHKEFFSLFSRISNWAVSRKCCSCLFAMDDLLICRDG
ncbi:hypothetical protein BVRB_7g166800 [Beta vulgaris subsp. vulgaris]|nr:hypothetical protein BVRB_7g166800 [Beta vulgaris subsp. vulgaris]